MRPAKVKAVCKGSVRMNGTLRAGGAVAIAVLTLVTTLAFSAVRTAQADRLRPVQDPRDRFTISVPEAWEVRTSTWEPAVEAKAPAREGGLPDTLQVISKDLTTSLTAEDCIAKAEWLMRYVSVGFKTVEKHPETIAGLSGFAHEYTWRTRSGVERRSYQVCVPVSRRVFMLIGNTTETSLSARGGLGEIARIIATFRPKGIPAGDGFHPAAGMGK